MSSHIPVYPPPDMVVGYPRAMTACAGFTFMPLTSQDVEGYTMANAFDNFNYHEDMSTMLITPMDATMGWGLEELEPTSFLYEPMSTIGSTGEPIAVPAPPTTPRARRRSCPDDIERRRAHRRSLQKGYEKVYRQRKRTSREELRLEWLNLEYHLKQTLVMAQTKAIVHPNKSDVSELCGEWIALQTERTVLESMLVMEKRLLDAREYCTQPKMREQLNALANTSCVMQYEFEW